MQSIVEQRNTVTFPAFIGERVYMQPFLKKDGLPEALRQRWQATIDAMLEGVETDKPIYLMIDQQRVTVGSYHRRPGLHIDGYWNPGVGHHTGHIHTNFLKEGLILASSVQACRAFIGEYHELPGDGGDCSHVDTSKMEEIIFKENNVYAGNVGLLHESLPVKQDCFRTLVRLNVPGWESVVI
jgi:hypothetical protein